MQLMGALYREPSPVDFTVSPLLASCENSVRSFSSPVDISFCLSGVTESEVVLSTQDR